MKALGGMRQKSHGALYLATTAALRNKMPIGGGSSPGSAGNFGLGVLARGLCLEAGPSLVFLIQILSDGGHLPAFEFGHLDRPPALGGADHGAEHQREHGLLAKALAMIFRRRRSSTNRRSRRFVVRIARRWVTGIRKCAMQASKSSVKQRTAGASSVAKSATTPAARSRAMARDGAW